MRTSYKPSFSFFHRCLVLVACLQLSGCVILSAVDAAASAAVSVAGLAVDAAVGTARLGGKVIGKAADAVLGSDETEAAAKGK